MEKYEVLSRLSEGASLEEFKDFIDNKVVVLAAIEKDAYDLRFASDRLKDDEDVVLFAISKKGMAISYASDRLKNRKDIVMKAIKNTVGRPYDAYYPTPLEFLPEEICNDKEIVMEAVQHSYRALKFASDEIKNDEECVNLAYSSFKKQLKYASEEFQCNPEYIYYWLRSLTDIDCSKDVLKIIVRSLTELAELKGWSKNEQVGKQLQKKIHDR